MASVNEYKIVRDNSKKLLKLLLKNDQTRISQLSEENLARYGFYHLILENVLGFQDDFENNDFEIVDDTLTKIIDVRYLNEIKGINTQGMDDYGIDVVNISELSGSQININLFNFKYRNRFSESHISDTDINRSTKFLDFLFEETTTLDESVNSYTHRILNILKTYTNSDSKFICNINLFMVSNENNGIHPQSESYVDTLRKKYNLTVNSITLEEIMSFYNDSTNNKKAVFVIPNEDLISFNLDSQTTSLSQIVKLPINEIFRLTCKDDLFPIEINPPLEKWRTAYSLKMDQSLLYDNVRGFLGNTPYNKKILSTLEKEPDKFFLYNNGITIVAETIESVKRINKFEVSLSNFQIVNGGQTLSSIFNFVNNLKLNGKTDDEISDILTPIFNSHVLVRLYKVPTESDLKNLIAEYTNSQNSISDLNLKSISKIQILIEKHLKQHNIVYARKAGVVGTDIEHPVLRIDMAELAQIIYSANGNPEKVSSQKKKLFRELYQEIFPESLNLDEVLQLIYLREDIRIEYINSKFSQSEQKVFYILYMYLNHDLAIKHCIDLLEYMIRTFHTTTPISDTRKLIQVKFKTQLVNFLDPSQIPIV
ncbi:hypothetical protein Exig_2378 [Exiguobacterium sibiricum 255-15]|uniref:Abortive phage infection protein C-terminal domain-containing protein n=1 Tax=Exiguobacterium sibiricum (strain DSM 17290 / CCUG 55495 / CIP 109462 / JCM 13490 / 255-15) TaxID=262543 RepID=B1YL26_EXIS2|nr:hypothetical protein Exig_2378 [Exiguobacterium sibiricum 255-15]